MTVRVHERTPEKLMLKALEVVKTGIGMPAFIGDKGHIEFLLSRGIPVSIARDYILAGCLDINLSGNSVIVSEPMFIVPRVFDIFMHNGVDPRTGKQVGPQTGEFTVFKSFEELLKAFKKQMKYFMEKHAEFNNVFHETFAELYPLPFASSIMSDGIKAGKEEFIPEPEETLADSIAVGVPRNPVKALRAIRRAHGEMITVSDQEILEAIRLLGSTAGIFAEPAAAAGFAGLAKASRTGLIAAEEVVVGIVTGNGLKDVASGLKAAGEPIRIPPDLNELARILEEGGKVR